MIGKLQYKVHSRPDIALVIGIVARFSETPKEKHIMELKRVLIYLKGIENYGLHYKRSDGFELNVFTDFDWARNIDDKKALVEVHSF